MLYSNQVIIDDIVKSCLGSDYLFEDNNNTVQWIPTDTEKAFKSNCKKYPNKMKYWIENPFSYNVNKYGFRTTDLENLSSNKKLLTVGCSQTFGIGVPEEHIWPTLLAKELDLELINLGVPGGSPDSCYRVIRAWFDVIKPSLIVIALPDIERKEEFDTSKQRIQKMCVHTESRRLNLDDNYNQFYTEKNILAIQQIIKDTPIVITNHFFKPYEKTARDLNHQGIDAHFDFYKHVLLKVNRINYSKGL